MAYTVAYIVNDLSVTVTQYVVVWFFATESSLFVIEKLRQLQTTAILSLFVDLMVVAISICRIILDRGSFRRRVSLIC